MIFKNTIVLLWVAVTAGVTVFLVRLSRARVVLTDLIPGPLGGADDGPVSGLRPAVRLVSVVNRYGQIG